MRPAAGLVNRVGASELALDAGKQSLVGHYDLLSKWSDEVRRVTMGGWTRRRQSGRRFKMTDEVVEPETYGALPLSYGARLASRAGGTRTHNLRGMSHGLQSGSRSCFGGEEAVSCPLPWRRLLNFWNERRLSEIPFEAQGAGRLPSRSPPQSSVSQPGIEPGLRASRARVRIRHTPGTCCFSVSRLQVEPRRVIPRTTVHHSLPQGVNPWSLSPPEPLPAESRRHPRVTDGS